MTDVHMRPPATLGSRAASVKTRARWWQWLSVPIAALAIVAAVAGIAGHETYARETANWAAQAVGQDYANVFAYLVLGALAIAAARGSPSTRLLFTSRGCSWCTSWSSGYPYTR
jgi:hypothetical protein